MAVDILDWNSIIDWLYNPFTQTEDTIHIGGGESGDPSAEERTIPNSSPFQIKLFFTPKYEIPSNVIINIKGGATLYEVPSIQEPGYNQFRVCYDEKGIGIVEFNSLQKNQIVQIHYKATASTIQTALFESFKNKVLGDIDDKFQDTFLPFSNGIDWVTKNLNTTGFNGEINHIAYDENLHKFIAVGKLTTYLKIWTSENLTDWTEILSVNKGAMTWGFKKIVYSDTLKIWVAIGDYIYTSYNLTDWTERPSPTYIYMAAPPIVLGIFSVEYVNDCIWIENLEIFIAVGKSKSITTYMHPLNKYAAIKSEDGITWEFMELVDSSDPSDIRELFFINYENGYILTGGDCVNRAELLYSVDSVTWNKIEIATHTSHKHSIYVDSMLLWVVVGDDGKIATASGLNIAVWTNRVSGVATDLQRVSKTESTIITAGVDKVILTSVNGTAWTDRSLAGTDDWNVKDIIFENDILIIVTDDNRIIYSDDITNFIELPLTPITINLLGISYINNIFMLYGDSGFIATNGLFFWGLTDSRFSLTETNYNEINTRLLNVENYSKSREIIGLTDSYNKIYNYSGDYDHDLYISEGIKCWDETLTEFMGISIAMIKKIDATWAAGTNQGGMFTGAVGANTTYHFFMIKKDDDGSLDYGFDTDIDCANIPAGYTYYRRLWSVTTDSSANIIRFYQHGKFCQWLTKILDSTSTFTDNNRKTYTITTPLGIVTRAKCQMICSNGDGGAKAYFKIESLICTDSAVTLQNSDFQSFASEGTTENVARITKDIETNTSKQICARTSDYTAGVADSWTIYLNTLGYEDFSL